MFVSPPLIVDTCSLSSVYTKFFKFVQRYLLLDSCTSDDVLLDILHSHLMDSSLELVGKILLLLLCHFHQRTALVSRHSSGMYSAAQPQVYK